MVKQFNSYSFLETIYKQEQIFFFFNRTLEGYNIVRGRGITDFPSLCLNWQTLAIAIWWWRPRLHPSLPPPPTIPLTAAGVTTALAATATATKNPSRSERSPSPTPNDAAGTTTTPLPIPIPILPIPSLITPGSISNFT